MNLGELFSYINYVANKDKLGEPLSPQNYQSLIKVVDSQYYKSEFSKILVALDKAGDAILKLFNSSPLYRFLSEAMLTVTSGSASLPTDLGYTINGTVLIGSNWKSAEFLSVGDADELKYNVLSPDLSLHPIFVQTPSGYNFIPTSVSSAKVNYLRKEIVPYFDYCIGSDDNVYYMPVGSSITATGDLIDSSSKVIVSGVTHPDNPTLPYTSVSLEFDWDEVDKVKLADMIIEMASIRSKDFNTATIMNQEAKQ